MAVEERAWEGFVMKEVDEVVVEDEGEAGMGL